VITASFALVLVVFTRVFALHVAAPRLLAATASAYVLATLFGAVALLAGGITGHRAFAAGIASSAAIAAYLLSSLAALVEGLKRFRPISPFWWYSGHDPLRRGLEPLHIALLLAATLLCLAGAVVTFERRDLA
jgi:ABC-2 type transport system permease protein